MNIKHVNNFMLKKQQNTIHLVTRPILMLARCCGVLPVSGLMSKSSSNLRSTAKSPYTLVILLGFLGQITISLLALINICETKISPRKFQKFVTNTAGAAFMLLILWFGKNWPEFVQTVTSIEKSLPKFYQKNIKITCNVVSVIVFSLAILEFILSVRFYSRVAYACPEGNSLMESYYIYTMPTTAARIPFSILNFIIVQLLIIQVIFVSNFADVLIIVISMYLSVYFDELNDLVHLYKDKSPNIWNVLRVHYTKLTRLVKIVDDKLSPFVLLSFGVNMIVICIQLFKILRKELAHGGTNCDEDKLHDAVDSLDRSLYINFSVIFLIVRAIVTALFATRVHTAAKAPLSALYEVPSCCYNTEARRFVEQIHSNTIALSGQHFFYVTRNMILTMVATVFTYELVLIQFTTSV